jgi:hypothetical protein
VDKSFKIGLLVLGCIFLFLYSIHGRYEYRFKGGAFAVFDTSKGIMYVVGKDTTLQTWDIVAKAKAKAKKGN